MGMVTAIALFWSSEPNPAWWWWGGGAFPSKAPSALLYCTVPAVLIRARCAVEIEVRVLCTQYRYGYGREVSSRSSFW
jgi:hypothetical protein